MSGPKAVACRNEVCQGYPVVFTSSYDEKNSLGISGSYLWAGVLPIIWPQHTVLKKTKKHIGKNWEGLVKFSQKVDIETEVFWKCCLLTAVKECGCIVVYSNAAQEHLNTILYTGFVEELVDILELKDANLTVSFCSLSFCQMQWLMASASQFVFCVSGSDSSSDITAGVVRIVGHKSNSIENTCRNCTSRQKSQVWCCCWYINFV